jgi:hypothetical protein
MREKLFEHFGEGCLSKALVDLHVHKNDSAVLLLVGSDLIGSNGVVGGVSPNEAHTIAYESISASLSEILSSAVGAIRNLSWKTIVECPMMIPQTLDLLVDKLHEVSVTGPGKALNQLLAFVEKNMRIVWSYLRELFGYKEPEEVRKTEEEASGFFSHVAAYAYDAVKRVASLLASGLHQLLSWLREVIYDGISRMADVFIGTIESVWSSTNAAFGEIKRRLVEVAFFIYSAVCDMQTFAIRTAAFVKERFEVFARRFGAITEKVTRWISATKVSIGLTGTWLHDTIKAAVGQVGSHFEWALSYLPWLSQAIKFVASAASTVFTSLLSMAGFMQTIIGGFFGKYLKPERAKSQSFSGGEVEAREGKEAGPKADGSADLKAIYDRLVDFKESDYLPRSLRRHVDKTVSLTAAFFEQVNDAQEHLGAATMGASDKEILETNDLFAKLMTSLYYEDIDAIDMGQLTKCVLMRTGFTPEGYGNLREAVMTLATETYTKVITWIISSSAKVASLEEEAPIGGPYKEYAYRDRIRQLKLMTIPQLYAALNLLKPGEDDYELKRKHVLDQLTIKQNEEASKDFSAEQKRLREEYAKKSVGELSTLFHDFDTKYTIAKRGVENMQTQRALFNQDANTAIMEQYLALKDEADRVNLPLASLLGKDDGALTVQAYNFLTSDATQQAETSFYVSAYSYMKQRNMIASLINEKSAPAFVAKTVALIAASVLMAYGGYYVLAQVLSVDPGSIIVTTLSPTEPTGYWQSAKAMFGYTAMTVSNMFKVPSVGDAYNVRVWQLYYEKAISGSLMSLVADDMSKFINFGSVFLTSSIPNMLTVFFTVFFALVVALFRFTDWALPNYYSGRSKLTFYALLTVFKTAGLNTANSLFNIFISILTMRLEKGAAVLGVMGSFGMGAASIAFNPFGMVRSLVSGRVDKMKQNVETVKNLKPSSFLISSEIWTKIWPVNPAEEMEPLPLLTLADLFSTQVDRDLVDKMKLYLGAGSSADGRLPQPKAALPGPKPSIPQIEEGKRVVNKRGAVVLRMPDGREVPIDEDEDTE